MRPEFEQEDMEGLERFRDHFHSRHDRLSKQDVMVACECWQAVRYYVTTTDIATVLRDGRLALFTHSGLLDIYMSIMTDQRLRVGSYNPFKHRLTLFAKNQMDLLSFHNAPTERVRAEVLLQHKHFKEPPPEIVFAWLIFAYFGECGRGVTTAYYDKRRVNESNAVVAAGMPVVLVCVHDAQGLPESYVLHASGTRVTWTSDAAYALYLYVALYYVFNIDTRGSPVPNASGSPARYPNSNALSIELLARKVMGLQGSLPRNTPKNLRQKSRHISRCLGDGYCIMVMNQEKNSAKAGHVMDLQEDL